MGPGFEGPRKLDHVDKPVWSGASEGGRARLVGERVAEDLAGRARGRGGREPRPGDKYGLRVGPRHQRVHDGL